MITDLKAVVRSLAKAPGFSLIVVLTLALGIGVNTAIFSFFNAILLRPLPFAAPERTVLVKDRARDFGEIVGAKVGLFSEDFREIERQARSFEAMATLTLDVATLKGRERPDLVFGAVVSHNFFSVLGSEAVVGRRFSELDRRDATGRLLVLSHKYWQSAFGGDPAVVGQGVTLNNVAFTVVGVMPPDFDFPRSVNFWATPASVVPEAMIGAPPGMDRGNTNAGRGNPLRSIVARLRPGVPEVAAERELASLAEGLPNPNQVKRSVFLVTVRDQTVGETRPALVTLLGCVGIVLVIACANVANLMLSRSATRQQEVKLRLALGSSRWLIVRRQLVESLVLSLVGGGLGLLLSRGALDLFVQAAPDSIPRLSYVGIDGSVVGFALGAALFTGVLCGLAPMIALADRDVLAATNSATRGLSSHPATRRLRTAFVVGEVAISVVLLVAAGLLLRSFWKTQSFAWGFDPSHVVTARVGFTSERYREPQTQLAFYRALLDKLAEQPGVEKSAASFDRNGFTWIHLRFTPEGHEYPKPQDAPEARYRIVSPSYFDLLRIRLVQGRGFAESDDERSRPVAIIDADLARRFFPDGQAVGKRVRLAMGEPVWAEIVGVAASVQSDGPGQTVRPDLYIPFAQRPMDSLFVQVRTTLGAANAGETIRKVVQSLDPQLPVVDGSSMEQVVARASDARRFPLKLIGAFAVLAVILAAVGIYAVTSYGVVQRTREIGVRMALGAQPSETIGLIMRQSFRPIAFGLLLGLAGSVVVALSMRTLLFGVEALDGQTFALMPLPLVLAGVLACWLPARCATRIDPLLAMRAE
ncbi:MAG: ABC transporter permease [Opitutaceae bacterium]